MSVHGVTSGYDGRISGMVDPGLDPTGPDWHISNVEADPDADTVEIQRPETVLDEAARITSGDRQRDYGHPRDNHGLTAQLWSAFLGINITARDVCWLNVLQKLSRDRHFAKRDNLVDVAGFVRNAEMLDE